MAKTNNKQTAPLTPEQVIRIRLRRLADREDINSFITKLVMMAAILGIMFGYVFGLTPMPNKDMMPKISNGDLLLYYRLEKNIRSDDVIVFHKNGKRYIGRIVARPNDEVEITETSTLKVNGSTLIESDIFYPTSLYISEIEYPLKLKDTEYFVLGDHRSEAEDSRVFGAVDITEIEGKVITVIKRSGI